MKKINLAFLFVLPLFVFGVNKSFALSFEEAQMAEVSKIPTSEIRAYNTGTLMKVTYVGAATEAVVAVDGTSFLTYAPTGVADLSLPIATYSTMGKLCDYIEALANYTCALTGGKRDDNSNLMLTTAASSSTDAKAAGGYSVLIGTGTAGATSAYINRLGIKPAKGKSVVLKYCVSTNAGTGTLLVYGKLMKFLSAQDGVTRNDTTLVTSLATANATALTSGNIYGGNWMQFAPDEHVVVSAGNVATAQIAGDAVQCFWDEK